MKTPDLLTLWIWSICYYKGMNLWMIPKPPCLAISMAISYSVTVSMGDETMGVFKGIFLEK
jgi:hypothetical protein